MIFKEVQKVLRKKKKIKRDVVHEKVEQFWNFCYRPVFLFDPVCRSISIPYTVTRRIVKFRYIHMMTQDDNGSVRENISRTRAG